METGQSSQFRSDDLADQAVRIASDLIRFDTTNTGDERSRGERQAAEYVQGLLKDSGFDPVYFESVPGRASVVVQVEGEDQARAPLVVHGHLDVVPAQASDWSQDPFCGEVIDGELWGRGAVDMKDMDGMMLAALLDMKKHGWKPARNLVVAFFADEENGGKLGAQWAVTHRPELFEGATEAVSEVGGFSTVIGGQRTYLIQTAEKGIAWLRLLARGNAGHGSAVNADNAVAHLACALSAIASHPWPMQLTRPVEQLLRGVAELTGLPFDPEDRHTLEALIDAVGPAKRFVAATLSTVANPTSLSAGYKINVVPSQAQGTLDVRYLPGQREEVLKVLADLAGDRVTWEFENDDVGLEAPFGTPLTDAMQESLALADPQGIVLPYLLSAGTDNKAMSRLGIHGYGFVPLKLPDGFDFTALFHGVDERVPVESLRFGAQVFADFLRRC